MTYYQEQNEKMMNLSPEEAAKYDGYHGNKKYFLKEYHNAHEETKPMMINRKIKKVKKNK